MAAAVNIAIYDAKATPVLHTFVPIGRDANGVYWWEDQSQASAIGYYRISMSVKRPPPARAGMSAGDRVFRSTIVLHTPVLETLGTNDNGLTPPSTVAYVPTMKFEAVVSERSTLQDRKDLRRLSEFMVEESQFIGLIENYILPT